MSAPSHAQLPGTAPSTGMFQVISLGDSSNDQQIREYKRRRPHRKSKGGCQGCKQRRVKCDQAMPACLRCRRNQRPCVYEGGGSGEGGSSSSSSHSDETKSQDGARHVQPVGWTSTANAQQGAPVRRVHGNVSHTSRSYASTTLVPIMKPGPPPPPPPTFIRSKPMPMPSLEYGTPSDELMHHFAMAGDGIYDMPNFMGPLIPLALQFPCLRGTILASAASHLLHKAPGSKAHHIAKHYQQAIALREYQTALVTPFKTQGQLGVDVLLITAMLMNMLSFCMPMDEGDSFVVWDGSQAGPPPPCADPDPDPRRSWVFGTHENRLSWLALQMGLTPLLIATAPWRENSRLRLLFANSDDERRTLSGTWQSLRRVPPNWLKLFGLDPKSRPYPGYRGSGVTTPASTTARGSSPGTAAAGGSPDSSASETISEADRLYRAPLRVVAELRLMEPSGRNLLQYFQLLGQLNSDFRHKLLDRDEKALWLFGMWMGLLCRYPNVWWTRRRTRCDFRAIRLWLHLVGVDQRPGEEGHMWRGLLRDLDDTWGYNFATDPIIHRVQSYSFG